MSDYEIKDSSLAEEGEKILSSMEIGMPVLQLVGLRFSKSKIFEGVKIAVGLHLTSETGALISTLKNGGADVYLAASNPQTINDSVAAALAVNHGIHVFADGSRPDKYEENIRKILSIKPNIIIDDGAIIISAAYRNYDKYCSELIGSTEQTTSGANILNKLAEGGFLRHPVLNINSSKSKHLFDNQYGVGQTFIQTCAKLSGAILGGKNIVICGYGFCGKGAAHMAKGMGADVIITEVDPFKVMEARMDGFTVMPIKLAAKVGDIFATFTGNTKIISYETMLLMKNGALLMNCGSGTTEVDVDGLKKHAFSKYAKNQFVDVYTLPNGRNVQIVCDGRVANIAVVGGNPSEVMDMSFGVHAMGVEYLLQHQASFDNCIMNVPHEIDEEIIKLKLLSYNISYDYQTEEQKQYKGNLNV